REHIVRACLVASLVGIVACSASEDVSQGAENEITSAPTRTDEPSSSSNPPSSEPTPSTDPPSNPTTPTAPAVTAEALLAKVKECATKLSTAPYSKDSGGAATIDVCGLGDIVFWKADLDVDCDGKESVVCNKSTDPSYQAQTAATDSKGGYLDASKLP